LSASSDLLVSEVLKVIFVKLLRKPNLYTKFEVVRFNNNAEISGGGPKIFGMLP